MGLENIIAATNSVFLVKLYLKRLNRDSLDHTELLNITEGLENLRREIIEIDEVLEKLGKNFITEKNESLTLLNCREDGHGKAIADCEISNEHSSEILCLEIEASGNVSASVETENFKSEIRECPNIQEKTEKEMSDLVDAVLEKRAVNVNWNSITNYLSNMGSNKDDGNIYKLWKLFFSTEFFSRNFDSADTEQKCIVFLDFNDFSYNDCGVCKVITYLSDHIKFAGNHVENLEKYWKQLEYIDFELHTFKDNHICFFSCEACNSKKLKKGDIIKHSLLQDHKQNVIQYYCENLCVDLKWNSLYKIDKKGYWFKCRACNDEAVKMYNILLHCKLPSHFENIKKLCQGHVNIDWGFHTFYTTDNNIKCQACDTSFSFNKFFNHSQETVHCNKVNEFHINNSGMQNHLIYESDKKLFYCDACGKMDIKDEDIYKHINDDKHLKELNIYNTFSIQKYQ